jgi:glutamate/tyrosine decarboxylase-like PLP-dependent enzyme
MDRNGRERPAFDEAGFRRMGYTFVDLMAEYLKGLEGRRVYGPVSPSGMDDLFDEPLPEEGSGFEDLVQECRTKVFPNSMAIGSRRYFGMMNPAPLPVAAFADALAAVMNQNVASWRHAPAATAIEKRVMRWLCGLAGLDEDAFGTLVPGGSLANVTGLKLAMNRALGRDLSRLDSEDPGCAGQLGALTFYVSTQGHYSFEKAVDLLGLGRGQLRKIPEDALFRIDPFRLEAAIAADRAAGRRPCCVIGIAGTTNTGSVDKLDRLADIAQRHGCWFHVDAAYGGAALLSERFRPLLRGIERADSITIDPHKWFYVPFEAGAVLVRHGDCLRHGFLVHPEYYMETGPRDEAGAVDAAGSPGARGATRSGNDPGPSPAGDPRSFHKGDKVNFFQYGIQGSRRFNALKIWLAVKMTGRRQYAAWIEKDIELARSLASLLRSDPEYELIGPNSLGICTFRWSPRLPAGRPPLPPEAVDQLNRDLQDLIEREGDAWFGHTVLKGRTALRVNVENRQMERRDVERLVQVLRRATARLHPGGSRGEADPASRGAAAAPPTGGQP